MSRTLRQILADANANDGSHGQEKRTTMEEVAQAAYWAGQEQMRGQIVRGLISRRKARKAGRYHHVEERAISEVLEDGLLGGQGRDDSAEFLSWDWEV